MEAVLRGNNLSGNHSKTHLYRNKTCKDSLSVQQAFLRSVAECKAKKVSRLFVLIVEEFESAEIVLVHHHVTERVEVKLIARSRGTFHHTDEFRAQLESVHLEVDLEEDIGHCEDGSFLRPRHMNRSAILRYCGKPSR